MSDHNNNNNNNNNNNDKRGGRRSSHSCSKRAIIRDSSVVVRVTEPCSSSSNNASSTGSNTTQKEENVTNNIRSRVEALAQEIGGLDELIRIANQIREEQGGLTDTTAIIPCSVVSSSSGGSSNTSAAGGGATLDPTPATAAGAPPVPAAFVERDLFVKREQEPVEGGGGRETSLATANSSFGDTITCTNDSNGNNIDDNIQKENTNDDEWDEVETAIIINSNSKRNNKNGDVARVITKCEDSLENNNDTTKRRNDNTNNINETMMKVESFFNNNQVATTDASTTNTNTKSSSKGPGGKCCLDIEERLNRPAATVKEDTNTSTKELEEKEEVAQRPDPISSSIFSSRNAAAPAPAPGAATATAVAFVERDFVEPEKGGGGGERRGAASPPLPRREDLNNHQEATISDAATTTTTKSKNRKKRKRQSLLASKEGGVDPSNPNNNGSSDETKKKKKTMEKKNPIPPSAAAVDETINTNDSINDIDSNLTSTSTKMTKNNNDVATKQGTTTRPARKKHIEQEEEEGVDADANYETDSAENNFCKLCCNHPEWENKIYYKCGTVLSKYFPKSNNNPNPGWYKGTICVHHVLSSSNSNSVSDYDCEEEAASSSEEERSEQQCIICNEIHYEDGDVETITQDDLKLQLKDGSRAKIILHPTKITKKASNSEQHHHHVDDVVPAAAAATLSDRNNRIWLEKFHLLQKFKAENGHCLLPTKNFVPDRSLGFWVGTQRSLHKKGRLDPDREQKLEEIGFEWAPGLQAGDHQWNQNYNKLKQFQAENGHCRVPQNYGPDPSLGKWVNKQRLFYKQDKIATDRVERLNEIGFDWDTHKTTWDEMFGRLEQFKAENGNCLAPKNFDPAPSLGRWVGNQRRLYKNDNMAPERVEKLNKIGFDWAPGLKARDPQWNEIYNKLKQFQAENGHCRVPQNYGPNPSLGRWVDTQRKLYKKGHLDPDREQKLEEIGFDWAHGAGDRAGDNRAGDQQWNEIYNKLKQFQTENGHCRVPRNYGPNPSLGRWVNMQRVAYKKDKMATDRVEELNKIGFDWEPGAKSHDQKWNENFNKLKQFKAENGHCRVPRNYGPGPSLGRWVKVQRSKHKKGHLDPGREQKLEEIGFEWAIVTETPDQKWLEKYNRLKHHIHIT